ncbi:MAG: hypothetical protein IJN95_00330 [Clostridia bacterium]|nr:hypothetical protein [Clostridia bacterium]
MKKVLSLLLAFILIFSCFSILGTTAASAETESSVAEPVVMKSDFENGTASKWTKTSSTASSVTFKQETGGDYYAHVGQVAEKNVGIRSTTFELIPGKEYELTFSFRLQANNGKSYFISDFYYIPSFLLYETTDSVGDSTTTKIVESKSGNFYAYVGQNPTRVGNGFEAKWTIGDFPTQTVTNYSHFNYQTNTTMVNNTSLTHNQKLPENAYANWTKVTAKIMAAGETADEKSQTVSFAAYFNAGVTATNYSFDIKDVKLVDKSVDGGAAAPATPEGHAFFNAFEEGSVENIAADLSELRLVSVEESEASYPVVGNKYLKYVSNNSSKGVAFNFTNNPNYKYKISYDLKVGASGSGTLKTTAASTELFNHSSATIGAWEHYEYDFSDATEGEVTVKLLASNSGWQVGIDNIKVEMISNANLENLNTITDGTYAFNIRTETENNKQGLRFKSKIDFNELNLTEGAKIVEYGTLVTAATNKANLKLENVDNTKVLAGVAFDANTGTDIRYSFEDNVLVYTGVITGIEVQNYDKELAVCGYTVVETVGGARFVIYDDVTEISVLAAAEQIVAESQSEDDKAAAQSVINDYNTLNQ